MQFKVFCKIHKTKIRCNNKHMPVLQRPQEKTQQVQMLRRDQTYGSLSSSPRNAQKKGVLNPKIPVMMILVQINLHSRGSINNSKKKKKEEKKKRILGGGEQVFYRTLQPNNASSYEDHNMICEWIFHYKYCSNTIILQAAQKSKVRSQYDPTLPPETRFPFRLPTKQKHFSNIRCNYRHMPEPQRSEEWSPASPNGMIRPDTLFT